jgi:uncharacterized protein (DUF885 family)
MKKQLALFVIGVAMSTAMGARAAAEDWKQKFAKVSEEYFNQMYFRYAPSSGTVAGFHQYDNQLENLSRTTIDKQVADLKGILAKLESIRSLRKPSFDGTIIFNVQFSADGVPTVLGIAKKSDGWTDELVSKARELLVEQLHNPDTVKKFRAVGKPAVEIHLVLYPTNDPVGQDLEIVLSNIHSELLTLETIRFWEKDADNYSSACAQGAFVLMERKFAPTDDRLRSLIAREAQMPALLAAARVNLKNPPRIYTEIAIEQLPDIISFFQNDVPSAFADAKDPALKARFATSNAQVIAELQSYLAWLKTDLLARSNGDFRIGADTFSKKLAYDEMVDTPLDKLLEIGWADLRKNQEHFKQVAKELEPEKDVPAVLEELGANHPAPDHLLDAFRATFDSLVGFIHSHHIVTLPSDVRPTLEETPPFERATTTASMDTPGPFETHSTQAYFNVTLPDPKMTPAEVEGYMHSFNIGTVVSTAVHEAYPGHYVQYLFLPQAPSKVRKLLGANTDIEGWAHYTEQMMLDEGYGQPGVGAKDERESKFLRLGQLQDALLRNARFIVGIQMHTGHMSFDEAVEFFQKEGYQSKELGVVEAKRGTADPTYLYYTLGKLQIMKLREDLKKRQGAAFTLENFHDEFLKQGFPPIKIVREAMLGDDSPTL